MFWGTSDQWSTVPREPTGCTGLQHACMRTRAPETDRNASARTSPDKGILPQLSLSHLLYRPINNLSAHRVSSLGHFARSVLSDTHLASRRSPRPIKQYAALNSAAYEFVSPAAIFRSSPHRWASRAASRCPLASSKLPLQVSGLALLRYVDQIVCEGHPPSR